jgi:hypothetical protein
VNPHKLHFVCYRHGGIVTSGRNWPGSLDILQALPGPLVLGEHFVMPARRNGLQVCIGAIRGIGQTELRKRTLQALQGALGRLSWSDPTGVSEWCRPRTLIHPRNSNSYGAPRHVGLTGAHLVPSGRTKRQQECRALQEFASSPGPCCPQEGHKSVARPGKVSTSEAATGHAPRQYGVKLVRGPFVRLAPHPAACDGLEQLYELCGQVALNT